MAELDPNMYQEFLTARQAAKDAKQWADEMADKVKAAAGEDEELTVNGIPVGGYPYVNKFPAQKFLKDHPELAEQFMKWDTVKVLDENRLKRLAPDLYRQYQSRSLSIEG